MIHFHSNRSKSLPGDKASQGIYTTIILHSVWSVSIATDQGVCLGTKLVKAYVYMTIILHSVWSVSIAIAT